MSEIILYLFCTISSCLLLWIYPCAHQQAARRSGSRGRSESSAARNGLRMQVWSNPQAVQDYKGKATCGRRFFTRAQGALDANKTLREIVRDMSLPPPVRNLVALSSNA